MVITKKKKIIFFVYDIKSESLCLKEYKDENEKLTLTLKEIPEKIKWYGNNICYSFKNTVTFNKIYNIYGNTYKKIEKEYDFPIKDFNFIRSLWVLLFDGGNCFFFDLDGESTNNDILFINQELPIEFEILNDSYIIVLKKHCYI